jgi:hypothetical protein
VVASARKGFQALTDAVLQRAASNHVASLYHKAFELYGPLCFWSTKEMDVPSISDALDAASRLKREGNMASRRLAVEIEDACVADL